jgi:hypothetical protein
MILRGRRWFSANRMQTASFGACVVALVHLSLGSAKARNDAFHFRCNLAGECQCNQNSKALTPLYVTDVDTNKPIQLRVDRRYLDRWSRRSVSVGSAYFRLRANTFEPWPDSLLTTSRALPHVTILYGRNTDRSLPGGPPAEILLRGIVYNSILRLNRDFAGPRPFRLEPTSTNLYKISMTRPPPSPYLKNDYFIDADPAKNLIACLREKLHPQGFLGCRHHADFADVSVTLTYNRPLLKEWTRIRKATENLLICFGHSNIKRH